MGLKKKVISNLLNIPDQPSVSAGPQYNRTLFEHLPIGLALCRMDGKLVDVNEAYAAILGRTVAETLRLTYWDVTPEKYAAKEKEQLESLNKTGRYGPYEKEYIHKDGHLVPVRLSGRSVQIDGQMFIWSSVEDVSERKNAETELLRKTAELSRSQADKEQLEVFTYLASHDLQEPLQKIIGFSELLKSHSKKDMDAKGQDYLDRVQNAARRMTQMIHDLLSFSRIATQDRTFETVELQSVIDEVQSDLEMRIDRTGGRVECLTPLPAVHADRPYMRQLFQNLIGNALKFRKKTEAPLIKISSRPISDGRVEIVVEDNGIGFDQEHAERIFKPFERIHGKGDYEGSGMGLAICHKIVTRHHGQISVEGRPGQGAIFKIVLPAQGAA